VPTSGVTLDDNGLFKKVMEYNIAYLLNSFSVNHMLYPFRVRAGQKDPPDDKPQVKYWDSVLKGSNASRFLMGAGNTLRWMEDVELRKSMNEVIDGIATCKEPNGYLLGYPLNEMITADKRNNHNSIILFHGLSMG